MHKNLCSALFAAKPWHAARLAAFSFYRFQRIGPSAWAPATMDREWPALQQPDNQPPRRLYGKRLRQDGFSTFVVADGRAYKHASSVVEGSWNHPTLSGRRVYMLSIREGAAKSTRSPGKSTT